MRIAKGLEPYLKRVALSTRVRRRGNRLAAPLDPSQIETVMVYRPERYGDMMATLPALRAIKAAFPHWHVSVWTSPQGREVLLPETLVDEIEIVNRKVSDRRIARGRPSFDLVLDLIQRDSVLTLWVCTAAARKGILAGFGKDELQGYYDWARALGPSDEYAMWRGMGVLELFGLPDRRADLSLRYTARERAWAEGILATWPRPVILNISAHDRVQRFWPEEAWAGLTAHLVAQLDRPVLLNAIGPERECALRIAAAHPDSVFTLPEGTEFRSVACLVSQAAFFVSPDTSLMHVAGPAGVPTVGLYPLRYEFRWTWVPPGKHVRIVYSEVPRSFREIPLSAVTSAIDDLLAGYAEARRAGAVK
jgi:ADP-heptose:LPS heptosyltransferase